MRPFGDNSVSRRRKQNKEVILMMIATEQVWESFHAPLLHFIRTHVADSVSAEDILQDVFLKVHQQIETLKDIKKLESWVYQITRHAIIDYYRSKRSLVTLEEPEVLQMPEELPDDDIVSELFPSVRAMVNSLPAADRQVLVLTGYQGLTQKELGERLGLSFSGAKSRVQRAREKLKRMLLECCHFELDRRGHVINYQSHCQRCIVDVDVCCADPTPLPLIPVRPF
jgi:RNA polymerase sigma-70 factor, ECF subfamily